MKRSREVKESMLINNELPHCTDLGGYPLYYLLEGYRTHNVLCSDCATKAYSELEEEQKLYFDANYESNDLYCDACSRRIPSAYGEDEATLYIQVDHEKTEILENGYCEKCLTPAQDWIELDRFGNFDVFPAEDHAGNVCGFLCPGCAAKERKG